MPAVARAEPEPDEVPAPLGLVVVLVRRAAVDDDAVVEDLDLPRLEPEVETVRGVLEELVHEAHRRGSCLIQRAPGLLVAAEGVPGIEARTQAPVPREHGAEVGRGGSDCGRPARSTRCSCRPWPPSAGRTGSRSSAAPRPCCCPCASRAPPG